MQSTLNESVLPFEREFRRAAPARGSDAAHSLAGDETFLLAGSADLHGDALDDAASHPEQIEAEIEALLGLEPSVGSLAGSVALGVAAGVVATALLVPAGPALAFGAALGGYAGLLVASLRTGNTEKWRVTASSE